MSTYQFLSTEELNRLGRVTVSDVVPDESRQSLPIPVVTKSNTLEIAFFYSPSLVNPREGAKMAPPHYVARLNPVTGARSALERVTPGDFGRNDDPQALLGAFRLPDGMTSQTYLERRRRLFALYDALLTQFVVGATPDRALAREFDALFRELREPPVAPYYESIGERFFGWIRSAG